MLNARSCRNWLLEQFKAIGETDEKKVVAHHMSACSTNLPETDKFGISKQNVFGFWDFVGGRFSVWSAIGVLPLSLHFGFETMQRFLEGGYSIDQHLLNEKDTNVLSQASLEKCSIATWVAGLLPYNHSEAHFKGHPSLLPGTLQVCSTCATARYGEQRKRS